MSILEKTALANHLQIAKLLGDKRAEKNIGLGPEHFDPDDYPEPIPPAKSP